MASARVEKTRIGVGVIKASTEKKVVLPKVKVPVKVNDQFTWSAPRTDSAPAR
jgi:hypothetical protein